MRIARLLALLLPFAKRCARVGPKDQIIIVIMNISKSNSNNKVIIHISK